MNVPELEQKHINKAAQQICIIFAAVTWFSQTLHIHKQLKEQPFPVCLMRSGDVHPVRKLLQASADMMMMMLI